jgi:hypothetical protein
MGRRFRHQMLTECDVKNWLADANDRIQRLFGRIDGTVTVTVTQTIHRSWVRLSVRMTDFIGHRF